MIFVLKTGQCPSSPERAQERWQTVSLKQQSWGTFSPQEYHKVIAWAATCCFTKIKLKRAEILGPTLNLPSLCGANLCPSCCSLQPWECLMAALDLGMVSLGLFWGWSQLLNSNVCGVCLRSDAAALTSTEVRSVSLASIRSVTTFICSFLSNNPVFWLLKWGKFQGLRDKYSLSGSVTF